MSNPVILGRREFARRLSEYFANLTPEQKADVGRELNAFCERVEARQRERQKSVRSGNFPTPALQQDCWLTIDGIVPIEKGKRHRDYFVPDGEKPSKQFGLDLGNVRVSTLGTDGRVLHFEFKRISPETSLLILGAVEGSGAVLINFEYHVPKYTLRPNLSRREAITFLERQNG
jgi:hypothetical protein